MRPFFIILGLSGLFAFTAYSRDVRPEMERAAQFGRKAASLVTSERVVAFWSEDDARLIYRTDIDKAGHRFQEVDLKTGSRSPAFDHEALAAALGTAASKAPQAASLPLEHLEPVGGSRAVRFRAYGRDWHYDDATKEFSEDRIPPRPSAMIAPEEAMRTRSQASGSTSLTIENGTPGDIELFWVEGRGKRSLTGKSQPDRAARGKPMAAMSG